MKKEKKSTTTLYTLILMLLLSMDFSLEKRCFVEEMSIFSSFCHCMFDLYIEIFYLNLSVDLQTKVQRCQGLYQNISIN